MATILARKTAGGRRRFQAMIRRRGRPTLFQTFPNKTLAKEWAKKVEAELASSRFLSRVEEERHTLAEAIDRYLAEAISDLSPGEQRNRRRYLGWWSREIGVLALSEVRPPVITQTRQKLLKSVSGPTSNRYLAALSAMLSRAEKEWMWIGHNPVAKVRRRAEHRGRVRFLSEAERDRLLEACRESAEPRLYPLVLFALTTGARQGELLGIRWADVDAVDSSATLHNTKNGDRRTIAFPGRAADSLREMAKSKHSQRFLFAGARGKPNFPKQAWAAVLGEAEIEDFRFHDLRHTAASYLAMSGASLPELAAFLGHRTLAMVQRYAHLTDSHSRAVAERMAEKFLSG